MPPGSAPGTGGPHWQGGRKNDAKKYIDHGCFPDPDSPDVYCFCNTQPRIKAVRRVTRKESSPNLGREFFACNNWTDGGDCHFFLWADEAPSMGRRYRTPPPSGAASTSAPQPGPSSSAQKRARPTTSPPVSSFRPATTPTSAVSHAENFDDIDFDALSATVDDEIEDDYEEEPPTQYSTASPSQGRGAVPSSPSPSKKPRFTSFGGGGEGEGSSAAPVTPTKPPASSASSSTYAAIQNDPSSPFHQLQRSLFGPSSTPAPPLSSSPVKPSASGSGEDPFSALSSTLSGLPALLDSAKKEKERDGRLLQAAKKKEEGLKRQLDKAREEGERVKGENERLKERIRMLEEERNELRTRAR
ncbi:hypothetical protein JCM8547_003341 [Rhodosporidiobolus lusitaniae]